VFDVGFSELVLCFFVALVVLGPQKLPPLARALGRWTGRARSYVRNLTAELERETGSSTVMRELRGAGEALRREADAARTAVKDLSGTADSPPASSDASPPRERG
jgi:sec-independent protein translocase protein TatB